VTSCRRFSDLIIASDRISAACEYTARAGSHAIDAPFRRRSASARPRRRIVDNGFTLRAALPFRAPRHPATRAPPDSYGQSDMVRASMALAFVRYSSDYVADVPAANAAGLAPNQIGARQLQERDAAVQAMVDNQIRAIRAVSTAEASAAEAV
jgi:hypothetical protein